MQELEELRYLNIQESSNKMRLPTAREVAAERAREEACDRALQASAGADEDDSSCSEGEAVVAGTLARLRARSLAAAPAPAPAAGPLLARLAAALPARDPRLLLHYAALLDAAPARRLAACTEELMQSVEAAIAAGAGDVVMAAWLATAVAWPGPRVPRAPPALLALLQQLTPQQVEELGGALCAALPARELIALSDVLRGAGGGGGGGAASGPAALAERAMRGALVRLAGRGGRAGGGPLRPSEVVSALAGRWAALGAGAQLQAAALAARALAAAGGAGARELLAALPAPPPAAVKRNPDLLKVSVAVKTLQNLYAGC